MIRPPPRSTRTHTRFPDPPLFRASERVGDVPLHFLPRARVDQRPLVARPVQSVTDAQGADALREPRREGVVDARLHQKAVRADAGLARIDRKSTRLNSSLMRISYAVFCLKKTTKNKPTELYDQTKR